MAELEIYGVIDSALAKQVRQSLNKIPKDEPLDVYLSSPGGSLSDGVTIHNWLKQYSTVNVQMEGDAFSAATLITSAGDHVDMPANALMMVHDPWLMGMNPPVTIQELDKTAKYLKATKKQALQIYHAKTRMATGLLAEMMQAETYLDAPEAHARGFVDNVTSPRDIHAYGADAYNVVDADKLAKMLAQRPVNAQQESRERLAAIMERSIP